MIVMKFGGSSVANREQILKVLEIVRGRLERHPAVVCSAHKGMTNALIAAARDAARGHFNPGPVIEKQRAIAAELGCPADMLDPFYAEITDLLRGISLVRELSTRSLDYVSSFGERMSVRCIADFFARQGTPAKAYDIWDLGFITDSNFGAARPLEGYESRMKAIYETVATDGVVPVVTGFVGKNELGEITTVGRNGSDLTCTLLAAALDAEEAEIWTDTDGVMTADPAVVKGARNIPAMSFDEAAELAYFGSRVLHPATLLPAMKKNIPVRVLNTNSPEHPGTVIEETVKTERSGVTSIAYKENQCSLTITSARMLGQSGFLSRVFAVLGRRGVVVDMLATSEISVSLTAGDAQSLRGAITELTEFGDCRLEEHKTILVVVGSNLSRQHGAAAMILGAVADAGVNVRMLSFGIDSINFSMLIDDADVNRAVSTLHKVLFEAS